MGKGIKISIMALVILSSCLALFSSDKPKVLLVVREGPSADKELMLTQEVGLFRSYFYAFTQFAVIEF